MDLFELMCKVLDQNLFAQVDWARNSFYFKELKVGLLTLLLIFSKTIFMKYWENESKIQRWHLARPEQAGDLGA